jgi:glutamine amidotransferase
MSVAVVKLGVGNTASVMFALERLGVAAVLTDDPARIGEAERVILPGVGAAAHAMRLLRAKALGAVLRSFARPLLGICLGQQLLFESSEEGDAEGLGLMSGRVKRFAASAKTPTPHMGWSKLRPVRDNPLCEGVGAQDYTYFVHSYICPISDATIATAEYGTAFPAMVARGNIFGCQFHPERSGAVGARILRNFLSLPC